MLPEHLVHHRIHLRADPDGTHHLNAETFDQVSGDDDLTNQSHAQASVLGLDDHDPLTLDQLSFHVRLPEDDDPVHQPLAVGLTLLQAQELLHQEPLRVAHLRIPPGHLSLVLAQVFLVLLILISGHKKDLLGI